MRKIFYSILAALLLSHVFSNAMTRKVLFIGNSYTFTNNMPAIVDSIARAMGDTLIWDMSAPGGFTLQQHCNSTATITKIFSQQWDLVVVHEQSQMPSFPPSQVATDVYPYATRLDSFIRANDTCTQTMFMMTWGHANGDPMNCASYPVICTYDGMQMRLRESYLQMAADNHADVAPVGSAFKIMVDSAYSPWLFSSDSSHPVMAGSYLEACVIYSSIFHRGTRNCTFLSGLTPPDASKLQRIATKVVFDSLSLWQGTGHYPYAGFTHNNGASSIHFTNLSPVHTAHYWQFGDGAHDTAANPTHVYGMGYHVVQHTVTTPCFTETMSDTVYSPVGVIEVAAANDYVRILQQPGGNVTFRMLSSEAVEIEVYDSRGVLVRRASVPAGGELADNFVPGLYVYRLHTRDGRDFTTGKIGVY